MKEQENPTKVLYQPDFLHTRAGNDPKIVPTKNFIPYVLAGGWADLKAS